MKRNGKEVLQIGPRRLHEVMRMRMPGCARPETENSVLLQVVFDPAGKLYELVTPFWDLVHPLIHVYDFVVR